MKRTRHKSGQKCAIEHCNEDAVCAGVCHACYQSIRYHVKLGTAHVIAWQHKVARFVGRASTVGTGNVKSFRFQRKRGRAA